MKKLLEVARLVEAGRGEPGPGAGKCLGFGPFRPRSQDEDPSSSEAPLVCAFWVVIPMVFGADTSASVCGAQSNNLIPWRRTTLSPSQTGAAISRTERAEPTAG